MGEIIPKSAAAESIIADLGSTLSNAKVRGGTIGADAEKFLGQTVSLALEIALQRTALKESDGGLQAAVDKADGDSDDLVAALYDETYNLVGRPGDDPLLSLLYPNGSSAYTEGPTSEQPERMRLLANLLAKGVHPKIPAARLPDMIASIRTSADQLATALIAAQSSRVQLQQLDKIYAVLAKSGQVKLSRLKRRWKSDGMSEADIHQIIPDRPRSRGEG